MLNLVQNLHSTSSRYFNIYVFFTPCKCTHTYLQNLLARFMILAEDQLTWIIRRIQSDKELLQIVESVARPSHRPLLDEITTFNRSCSSLGPREIECYKSAYKPNIFSATPRWFGPRATAAFARKTRLKSLAGHRFPPKWTTDQR